TTTKRYREVQAQRRLTIRKESQSCGCLIMELSEAFVIEVNEETTMAKKKTFGRLTEEGNTVRNKKSFLGNGAHSCPQTLFATTRA
ncbi:unnamed protein product, partial [Ilex paraguariensis]